VNINPVVPNHIVFYPFEPSQPLNSLTTLLALGSIILDVLSLFAEIIKDPFGFQSIE